MPRYDLDLKTILDIPSWERVQDQLAKLTGTAIITIDMKGIPVTKHSCRTDFCSVIRENPVSRKRCYRCDALAGLEAVRAGRPYIYLCHCGIVDVAVPVMVGDRYLGAVMFGQVRIPNDDTEAKVERLVNEISSFQADEHSARSDLLDMYECLPEMEYKRIVEIANTINTIVEYIVEQALKNRNDKQTYEWLLSLESGDKGDRDGIQEIRDPSLDKGLEEDARSASIKKDSALYPAIAYMSSHPQEMVTMKAMANLCHLSESYFSRLFCKEMGENFINYVNRQKISRAKELLRDSSLSIAQITREVGYADASHFTRLFKRFEGVTPTVYRQYNYK